MVMNHLKYLYVILVTQSHCVITQKLTRNFTSIDTSNFKQICRHIDSNYIVTSESSGSLPYKFLKFKFTASLTKLPVCLLQQSNGVRIPQCSLRNTELTATNAG